MNTVLQQTDQDGPARQATDQGTSSVDWIEAPADGGFGPGHPKFLAPDAVVRVPLFDCRAQRTFRRTGDIPKIEIADPLEGHRGLLGVLTDADMHNVTAYLVTLK